jgi:hypothetical protein
MVCFTSPNSPGSASTPHGNRAAGQELDIYILDVDLERERLSLSLKRLKPDPWEKSDRTVPEGNWSRFKSRTSPPWSIRLSAGSPGNRGTDPHIRVCDHTISRPEEMCRLGHREPPASFRATQRSADRFSLKQAAEEESGEEIEQPSLETVQGKRPRARA